MSHPQYVVYESDDWSGLYVDGKLKRVGDGYLIDEELREIFGVVTIQNEDFFLGHKHPSREQVAQTLEEVDAFVATRTDRERAADTLRAEAARLLAEADLIENKA